jgi:(hydroxyamino)benzene mutase
MDMSTSSAQLTRQGQRLLQTGIALLFYSSLEGFAIPSLRSPRLGLSVHTLSALQGVMMLGLGLLWPRLRLGAPASWIAFWCAIHGALAILAAYTIAAAWGVGVKTISLAGELPHGLSRGSDAQEAFIKVLAYSSAPTGLTSFALVLWGLRFADARPSRDARHPAEVTGEVEQHPGRAHLTQSPAGAQPGPPQA